MSLRLLSSHRLRRMGWALLGCLLAAAGLPATAQPAGKVDGLKRVQKAPLARRLDSLRRILPRTTDTTRAMTLYRMAHCFPRHGATLDSLLTYLNRAYLEAARVPWDRGRALVATEQGRMLLIRPDYAQAQAKFYEALELWRRLGPPNYRQYLCEYNLGAVYTLTGGYAKAQDVLLTALRTAHTLRRQGTPVEIYYVYDGLANNALRRKKFVDALAYFKLALREAQTQKDTTRHYRSELATIYNNIADTHINLGQIKKALPYLAEARKLVSRAQPYAHALVLATSAQAYLLLKRPQEALGFALYALDIARRARLVEVEVQLTQILEDTYVARSEYAEAYRYAKETRRLQQELINQAQVGALAEQQAHYESIRRERDIKLLRQQNHIEQLNALQQRTLRNAAIVIAVLLLAAVGILYNRYRLRQRTVQLLDEQNREKELLLREKTLLLQEVHHRVKNNLQIVLSLLSNQLDTLPDPVAVAALRESQSRVQTMALIHQNLYQSDSLARIDMRRYLAELLGAIGQAFQREEVTLVLDVAPVHLTTHTAVPLGLVVNELATNAYKYAFAGRPAGNELRVELGPLPGGEPGSYRLVVADNGVGLPPLDLDVVQSLGLRLTAGLLRQMHARFTVGRTGGTRFAISFHELAAAGFDAAPAPGRLAARVPFS